MVREMNRLSLYEAIRKKKLSEGGHAAQPSADGGAVPVKTEPKPQVKPIIELKQPGKSGIRSQFQKLGSTSSAEPPVLIGLIKDLMRDTSWLIWAGFGLGLLLLLVVSFVLGTQYHRGGATDRNIVEPKTPVYQKKIEQPKQDKIDTKKPEIKPSSIAEPAVSDKQNVLVKVPAVPVVKAIQPVPIAAKPPAVEEPAKKPVSTGSNVIVIVAYTKQADLAPVKEYFGKNGIETEIITRGSYFLLITKDRFESTASGSDGYKTLQKIKQVGAAYKAPEGSERFGSKPFQDVYGMKIKP